MDRKPNPPDRMKGKGEGVSFQMDKNGSLVPVTKDGKPFVRCGGKEIERCGLSKEGIKVTSLKTVSITEIKYEFNPKCRTIQISFDGFTMSFDDPTDPACLK